MGTRGAIGFYRNGQDRITYNHFDSYPEYLGKAVLKFIQEISIEEMNKMFGDIVLVKDTYLEGLCAGVDMAAGTQPTDDQVQEVKDFFAKYTGNVDGWKDAMEENLGVKVSTGDEREWYRLLRMAQGDLFAYRHGLRYMIDSRDFMQDSLFCEYAYILNLDTNMLEFYVGFNRVPQNMEHNRYEQNDLHFCGGDSNDKFYAVRLCSEYLFDYIRELGPEEILKDMATHMPSD